MSSYLVLSHLNVKNANALSSPISIGVPAVTAFLGAAHKLQRCLNEGGFPSVRITGAGIIVHDFNLRTFSSVKRYASLIESGKPLTRKGERPSSIPDPKIDISISLVCDIEDDADEVEDVDIFLSRVDTALSTEIRIAGGDILPPRIKGGKATSSFAETGHIKYFQGIDADNPSELKDIKRLLSPGYALVERRDLLLKDMEEGRDPVETIVDYLAVHHDCNMSDDGRVEWTRRRKTAGWIVPISTGYQGLSMPDKVANQRNEDYLHVFGENLITLGEYRIISSVKNLNKIIWRYSTDLNKQKYMCTCNGGN